MIKPEPRVIHGLALAVTQHAEVRVWLQGMLDWELARLPYVVEHVAISQGRCQMLEELIKFVDGVPQLAAKLRSSPTDNAHR